ncbi:MAG TPA: hypothetical protein VK807_09435 [Gemmatimonadaceae bacterium]|nr:hypothetical protein [Gemmatimonadaceae bacterium]
MTARALSALVVLAMQGAPLQRITRDQLCVTNGEITTTPNGRMAINTPSARAVVQMPTASDVAEIRFTYLGPSEGSKPLASGEMRRQVGLKLKALNQCNLLYVMWHIEPDTKVAVSIKRNPGQSTHEQCDAHGYTTIRPRVSTTLPRVLPGESRTLRAVPTGDDLTVTADTKIVWEGSIGNGLANIDGPVGLRTDNARFEFDYAVMPTARGSTTRCESSGGQDAGAD